jgi:DNA-binding CsgD family transcriptional regulator
MRVRRRVKVGSADEVSGVIVRTSLDALRRRGIDPAPLLDGLPIPPVPGRERYPWDAFAELVERQAELLGGPWRLAAALREDVGLDRRLRTLAGLFVSPSLLYLHLPPRMVTRMFWNLGARVDALPDGRIRFELRLPSRYRPTAAFFIGTVGTCEGLAQLVGHAPARVDAELSDHHAIYLVRPPPSRTVAGRIAAVLPRPEADPEVLADAVEMGLDSRFVAELAGRMGGELLDAPDAGVVLETLAEQVRERFLSRYLAWVSPEGETRVLLGDGPAPGARLVRELRAGDRFLGRLEVDLRGSTESAPVFEALVPWVALALDRAVRAAPLEGRLGAAVEAWGLSPRQAEALAGIVAGRSNKEIAAIMGTTVKTVELHVGKVFEKARCDGRTALLGRFYRDLPEP